MSENQVIEKQKFLTEFLKHVTTISTFAIVIIVGFIEKVFKNPEWKYLIAIALISYLLTIICATILFLISLGIVEEDVDQGNRGVQRRQGKIGLLMCLAFLVAFISLVVFFLKNY